jgi:hypothetical protein
MDRNSLHPFDSGTAAETASSRHTEEERAIRSAEPLPSGVRIEDVVLPSRGKIQQGEAGIRFFANGSVERAVIHLRNEREEAYTLEISPITGHVEVQDGYIEKETRPRRF